MLERKQVCRCESKRVSQCMNLPVPSWSRGPAPADAPSRCSHSRGPSARRLVQRSTATPQCPASCCAACTQPASHWPTPDSPSQTQNLRTDATQHIPLHQLPQHTYIYIHTHKQHEGYRGPLDIRDTPSIVYLALSLKSIDKPENIAISSNLLRILVLHRQEKKRT